MVIVLGSEELLCVSVRGFCRLIAVCSYVVLLFIVRVYSFPFISLFISCVPCKDLRPPLPSCTLNWSCVVFLFEFSLRFLPL